MPSGRIFFTFDTTHHVMWAEEIAAESQIPIQVVPAPAEAGSLCSLALETLPPDVEPLSAALQHADLPFGLYRSAAEAKG